MKDIFKKLSVWVGKPLIVLIQIYRLFLSPLLPHSCRFYPSCSAYAIEAVKKFGIFKGFFLAIRRILKCHPFHEGGFDPVPNSTLLNNNPSDLM